MSNTSLILRPSNQPPVRVLEVDGPRGAANVNHSPRLYGPPLTFEQWQALPEHVRNVVEQPETTDFNCATRLLRLFDRCVLRGNMSLRHAREVRWRIAILHPYAAEYSSLSRIHPMTKKHIA